MAQIATRPRAAIYLRISSDPEGRRLGVERQEKDCRELCDEYGYDDVGVFCDNDTSASSGRPRLEFNRMLTEARAGRIDVIVAFSTSRMTRQPIEWEAVFPLVRARGTQIHLVKTGLLDLTRAFARRNLRNDASSDAYYAEEISENVTTASRHRAEHGEWHGGQVPYGFVRVGPKGEPGKLEHHPERAEVVHDAARRILNGQTLYSVCMSLNQRGVTTAPSALAPDGARWHARTLKRILTSPNTVGIREYNGQRYNGRWEGILDRATWDRLRTILNDKDRATRESWLPAHKYVLSGLVRCGRESCGAKLVSNTANGRTSYLCSPTTNGCGRVRINLPALEEFVVRQVLAVLDVPPVREALSRREESNDDDELRQTIHEDERRLQRLEDDFYDGDGVDRAGYLRQRDRITDRLTDARRRLADLQRTTFMVELGDRTLREAWDANVNDLGWRRTLLHHVVDHVIVHPHPTGVTSTLTARRGESPEKLAERRREHRDLVMFRRAFVVWKAERLPEVAPDVDMAAFEHLSHAEKVHLWLSRMHAGQPVQVAEPGAVGDVAGLVRESAQRPRN